MFARGLGAHISRPLARSVARLFRRGQAPTDVTAPPADITAEYVPVFAPRNVQAQEVT